MRVTYPPVTVATIKSLTAIEKPKTFDRKFDQTLK